MSLWPHNSKRILIFTCMKKEILSELQNGDHLRIRGFACCKDFSRRLNELGLFEGAEVQIVKNDGFGPLILNVLNSKIALGRGESSKIYVERI